MMGIKERFQRKITITQYELSATAIFVMLSTLLLITTWPQFMSDAMSVPWYGYLVLMIIPLLLLYKGRLSK